MIMFRSPAIAIERRLESFDVRINSRIMLIDLVKSDTSGEKNSNYIDITMTRHLAWGVYDHETFDIVQIRDRLADGDLRLLVDLM